MLCSAKSLFNRTSKSAASVISKRSIIIGILFTLPVLVYVGFGAYALWETGLFRWTWWIIPGCWVLTYVIASLWRPQRIQPEVGQLPEHWTPQDKAATEIVMQFQQDVDQLAPDELTDIQVYWQKSQELAHALAQHYHPNSKELYSSLTVLEVLAAIRLAVEDFEEWFQDSVPGSHLVTIEQWKLLGKAPKWVKRASDAGWLASMVINPLNVAKFFSSKLTLQPIADELRGEFLAAVYLRFIRQVGFYLIEMNSGRLRRGAERYRATFGQLTDEKMNPSSQTSPGVKTKSVTVAIVGQVKSGKSSIVNALIGKREAVTDVLPSTTSISRHQFPIPGTQETITLLDTPGYADAGATKAELNELERAIEEADVVLLVTDAHSPGKAADVELIHELQLHAQSHPELKPAPVVLCLTHIDLLSPMMEWNPPYNWESPNLPKEKSIHDAIIAMRDLFGEDIAGVIGVCSDIDRSRSFNISEGLIPALAKVLDSGKAVAVLKAYERSLDQDRFSALLNQLKTSGKTLLNLWIEERLQQGKPKS